MLKFYYNPRSPMARRVWLGLLEKQIEFEPILVNLNGDQMQPEYLELNPFHHVPVIVDGDFRLIESLAILDYLEAKYLTPSLLPKQPQALAKVKMVQMVSTNELLPKIVSLIFASSDSPIYEQSKLHIDTVLEFMTATLGGNLYFGGENLSLADIVLGSDVSMLPRLGFSLSSYPILNSWYERLMQRKVWQKTQLSDEDFDQFTRVLRILRERRNRPSNAVSSVG
jgi:glutathione S-transferase